MSFLIQNGNVFYQRKIVKKDLLVDDHGNLTIADNIDLDCFDEIIDASNLLIIPGLIDPHVHLREPGYEYKETINSGTLSMAKGGYTTVFAMPNTKPVCDSVENIKYQLELIAKDAVINVIPYAAVSKGQKGEELTDINALSNYTFAFSDDGRGVQSDILLKKAMEEIVKVNGIMVAHCEDESLLLPKASIHDGKKAKEFGLVPISSESEYKMIARDLKIAEETGCSYHVCHISCKESVDLIRKAKKDNPNISCEVTVHHLILSEDDISSNDANFKMNPPLRTLEDKQALIDGINDGTIDMICTDHAPHAKHEKDKGFADSAMGIIGSELAFGLIYTHLVKTKKITLERAIECMSYNCADIFGVDGGELVSFEKANFAIFDLTKRDKITENYIVSKSKNTPFLNQYMHGICLMTVCDGNIVYRRDI